LKKLIYIVLFILPLSVQGQEYLSCPLGHYLEEVYENPLYEKWLSEYDVKFYHISLEVSNTSTVIDGFTTINVEALADMDTVVFQLIDVLDITEINVDGNAVSDFLHNNNAVYIPVSVSQGQTFSVTIYYNGDANQNRGFFAGITTKFDQSNGQDVTYTLSEPLNARDWFPVKQVLTDKADSAWIDLTCANSLMAGSNGVLEEIADAGGGKHTFKWRSRYPIAYYLISLAVADYRDYSYYTILPGSGDSLLVQNYIYDSDEYLAAWKEGIDRTGDFISLFSDLVVDYPFPLEKYGHCVAPLGGGMEHQTMTTLANFNFNLVSHELAHQWFGDNITCGNWQDIWINEGFASYFEYLALQYLEGQQLADDWMEYAKALAMGASGSVYVPVEEADNDYRVFDYALSYKKGATLLHMIRNEINDDETFFRVLKTYSQQFGGGMATAIDFMNVLDSVSGKDFSCFFDQWYYGEGYPTFNILWNRKNDTLYVESRQLSSSTVTPLFNVSFDLLLHTDAGDKTIRLYQETNDQVFAIPCENFIWSVEFDPEGYLLASSSVVMRLPDDKEFALGPNPTSDKILLMFSSITGEEYVRIYNLEGKLMGEKAIELNPFELDISSIPDGPYVLVVKGGPESYTEKIYKISSP